MLSSSRNGTQVRYLGSLIEVLTIEFPVIHLRSYKAPIASHQFGDSVLAVLPLEVLCQLVAGGGFSRAEGPVFWSTLRDLILIDMNNADFVRRLAAGVGRAILCDTEGDTVDFNSMGPVLDDTAISLPYKALPDGVQFTEITGPFTSIVMACGRPTIGASIDSYAKMDVYPPLIMNLAPGNRIDDEPSCISYFYRLRRVGLSSTPRFIH
ncbi:hypothetical protein BJ170DRAFT_685003 [Xylariales sp. AK1849]|nr:hypothetical protein BJ170DRAFT_685003 [Xylariales sp. AK1849]